MYLVAVKLRRILLWAAFAAGFLSLLFPKFVPLELPIGLAVSCGLLFFYTILHVRSTKRSDLRCPACGWVPFALNAWKCKECGFVWDTFSTDGVCPRCGHDHEETACVRCRRILPNSQWKSG
jgi:rubredoxin